jgi:hypothetical protein
MSFHSVKLLNWVESMLLATKNYDEERKLCNTS